VSNQNLSIECGNVTISCYENKIPTFVEAIMERLYENLFSSLVQFRIYGATTHASTYVVYKNKQPITIFLFRREGGHVRVINEVIKVHQEDVARFSTYIFDKYPSVSLIYFKAVETDVRTLPFPYQHVNCLEDIVLTLPETVDEYLSRLGKSTRKTIKGYMNKLKRDFPSFDYRIYTKDELTESQIREIIDFNRARMIKNNKTSAYDEHETERIIDLAKQCGLIGVATIDEKLCAGAICYRIGENYFMSVNAHDPAYDSYRLGTLGGFLIISACIDSGGKECHLLWGQHDYKYRFLGIRRDLDKLVVYRSHAHLLRHGKTATKILLRSYLRQTELWLRAARRQDSLTWRLANAAFTLLRHVKRLSQGPA